MGIALAGRRWIGKAAPVGLFKRKPKDDFKAMAKKRRDDEEEPWFAGDDDGPELSVETGIGSNLRRSRRDDR